MLNTTMGLTALASFAVHAEYTKAALRKVENIFELPITVGMDPSLFYLSGTVLILSEWIVWKRHRYRPQYRPK